MRTRTLLFTALAMLPAASAHAALTPRVAGPIIHDAQVLGSEVIYQTNSPRKHGTGRLLLRSLTGTAPATTVLTETNTSTGNPDEMHEVDHDVTASATAFAITTSMTDDSGAAASGDATLSLRLRSGGATTVLQTCHTDDGIPEVPPFALDGSRIAYIDGVCNTAPLAIVVHDANGGPDVRLPLPAGTRVGETVLRADFVAVTLGSPSGLPDRLLELRVNTGTPVQDVAAPYDAIAVQSDGTLAAAAERHNTTGHCTTATLTYYIAGNPTAHPLPGHPCGKITLAGGRITYDSGVDGIHLAGLDGTDRVLIPAPGYLADEFDADDASAAAVVRRCSDSALVIAPFTSVPSSVTPATCPLTITGHSLTYAHGKEHLKVSCPKGCQGVVWVSRTAHDNTLETLDFTVAPGAHTLTFPLGRTDRRYLGRRAFIALHEIVPNNTNHVVSRTVRLG